MPTRMPLLPALFVVGALAAATNAAAQDVDPEKAAACLQAVDGQDYGAVISVCPEVLDTLPEDHPYYAHWSQTVQYAYSLQCEPAAEAQQWDSVIAYCEMAVAANPGAFILNYYLGLAYQTKEDWANAAVRFSSFLDGVQGNSGAASQLSQQVSVAQRSAGLAYARVNAMQDAIPLLRAAAAANAADVEVQFRLGFALLSTGDNTAAEQALTVVIDNAPNPIPSVLFLAGQLNYNAGDYTRADTRLSAYLAAAPGDRGAPDAHYMLAQALQGSDEDRAVTHYQAFLGAAASGDERLPEANYALGTIFYNRDDCDNAETHYSQFLEMAPGHANAAQATEVLAAIAEGGCQQ